MPCDIHFSSLLLHILIFLTSATSVLLVDHQIYIINWYIKSVSMKYNFIKQVSIIFIKWVAIKDNTLHHISNMENIHSLTYQQKFKIHSVMIELYDIIRLLFSSSGIWTCTLSELTLFWYGAVKFLFLPSFSLFFYFSIYFFSYRFSKQCYIQWIELLN